MNSHVSYQISWIDEKYYEKLEDKYAVSRDSLKSVFDFFQLPTKVFSRSHADPRDWICNQSYFKTRDDPNLSKMIKAEYKEVLKNSESIHFKQIEQVRVIVLSGIVGKA